MLLTSALAAGTVALSGCMQFSPMTTELHYDPADGVSTTLGDLAVHDLLVVSAAKGDPGVVSGYVVNSGDEKLVLQIKGPNAVATQTTVPAHGTVQLQGGDTPTVQLSTTTVRPGAMLDLQLKTAGHGSNTVPVPVLLPREYYSGVTPTPEPSTTNPSPTGTSTGG